MTIDIKTLVLIILIVNIINVITMAIIWRQFRERFSGMSLWLIDMVFQATGIAMIFFRGYIPDFISIVISNTLIISGSVFILIGLEIFLDKKGPQVQNFILIIVFFFLDIFFAFISPDITAREILISSMVAIFTSQACWLLFKRAPSELRRITRVAGVVMSGYALSSFARIILLVLFPVKTSDFFKSGLADSMALAVYLTLHICLIIALILMVTKRLLGEVQVQEEKFTKAFHSSPYAILLTGLYDGKIFEVNDGFVKITGYRREEVIGKTTLDLHLWMKNEDRETVINKLSRDNTAEEIEIKVNKKSGEIITGLLSADIIVIDNKKYILSSISDITGRKLAEEKIKNLLQEKELILKEVHHRIKNNMNTINALLILQAESQENIHCRNILNDAGSRVQSMMILYDKLYRSDNHRELSINEFLPLLAGEIIGLFRTSASIKTEIHIEDFMLSAETLSSIGIIINEMITNSMKYAFRDAESGIISISAVKNDNTIKITYADNGIGFPVDATFTDSKGFGMQLIAMLVEQIHGSITVERDSGTKYIIEFKAEDMTC